MAQQRGGVISWVRRSAGTLSALAVGALIAVILLTGRVQVTITDDKLIVRGPAMYATEVALADIQSVQEWLELDKGQRLYGYGGYRVSAGDYRSPSLGDYKLYIYNHAEPGYVDVVTPDGHLVFNALDKYVTHELYRVLTEKINPTGERDAAP